MVILPELVRLIARGQGVPQFVPVRLKAIKRRISLNQGWTNGLIKVPFKMLFLIRVSFIQHQNSKSISRHHTYVYQYQSCVSITSNQFCEKGAVRVK